MLNFISRWREIRSLKRQRRELNINLRTQVIRTNAYAPDCLAIAEDLKAVDARISELQNNGHKGYSKKAEIKRLEKEISRLHMVFMQADNGSLDCVSSSRELSEVRRKLQELKGG